MALASTTQYDPTGAEPPTHKTSRRGRRVIGSKAKQAQAAGVHLFNDEVVEWAILDILEVFDDPKRPSLKDTPKRVAHMYSELLKKPRFTFTMFDAEGADQMILERDIPFYTLCEHHLLPFYGTATVAYIPNGKIAGLSKLARTVDFYAHALQTQERLTNQIADFLLDILEPQGVGVVVSATHLCMEMRGVCKPGASTVTSALRGAMRSDDKARAEFLSLAYAHAK